VSGALCGDGNDLIPFIGAAFLDPSRRDEHGRPIAHYVIWFRVGDAVADALENTPLGWESVFLEHVSDVFDSPDVFGAPKGDHSGDESFRAALSSRLKAVAGTFVVTGPSLPATACRDVGTIKSMREGAEFSEDAPAHQPFNPAREPAGIATVTPKRLAVDIASAIASGEAWALTHDSGWLGKRFPSIGASRDFISRLRGQEDEQELNSRILKSFSGSQEDQFIQSRLAHVHGRFLKSKSDVEPTRGFDAVVDCLINAGFRDILAELDEHQACEQLAATVAHGAFSGDRFIRNLLLRIRASIESHTHTED
tara:strand:+ start:14242 stop:15171 length:930 start_codon:yes stop_codon:yes gene_type:complete